ncbi:MAG: flagellar biosynthesis anti-sigma factor FlgM [Gammaproteobacteria bacterium]|nr:flagellar biosynthesis anti-sigma factor FlgM [Gammaproteobacteria bacterium]MBU1646166.1 flagellar biosynthesis anti-sigma factor FlgM [Gammaproteobacteria bacterium]MBU1972228.1 flagellar biosynthesis anti-sigma factor FlgM [Gammaproteobacteria bacterium]
MANRPAASNNAPRQQEQPATAPRVDISSLSARLQVISAELTAAPPIDVARITEIKQAIAEGRFSINPERIADGLLQSVHEMLGKQR